MDDLVTFLRARLDEDESCARAAVQTSARWAPYVTGLDSGLDGAAGTDGMHGADGADGRHGRPGVDGRHRVDGASPARRADGPGIQDQDGNLVAASGGRPYPSESQVRHIVRHDPARVLREVAAKRMLVERLGRGRSAASRESVRLLALPYAQHPDYQPEWSPA